MEILRIKKVGLISGDVYMIKLFLIGKEIKKKIGKDKWCEIYLNDAKIIEVEIKKRIWGIIITMHYPLWIIIKGNWTNELKYKIGNFETIKDIRYDLMSSMQLIMNMKK